MKTILRIFVALLLFFCKPNSCKAYSVLAHEALIDAAWDHYLVPLLKAKYPFLNDSMLKEAHAYAYGGAVAPDMGYYPFGSKLFTNLVHYVRSGDFVMALLDEAQNPNEYAFALGCLCHYYADIYGHSLGVNVSVPIAYPKDKEKYGTIVTYEEDETAHKRVEFSFDVAQTAKGNYASHTYHDMIGFKISEPVLDRAFYKTYDLHLTDIFPNLSRAVNTFRWAVNSFFPEITKAAWAFKKKDLQKTNPTITGRQFRYRMRRVNYNKEYGRDRERPKFFAYLIATIIKILPKIGPLAPLKFKPPSTEVEKHYMQSFDTTLAHYTVAVQSLQNQKIFLPDKDYDTGKNTQAGEYGLTDDSYCQLLLKLQDKKFDSVNLALQQNIVHFFSDPQIILSKKDNDDKQKIMDALDELKKAKTTAAILE